MSKQIILKVKKVREHYEMFVNDKFSGSCDFNELYQTIEEIKMEYDIDKIEFI